eukprot:1138316-Pelagomonas_calceolata.AAC.4
MTILESTSDAACVGVYRSLLERVVGARLVYKQPSMARVISFEYLNRQLVWHEISELLLLLLPLLDAAKFRSATAAAVASTGCSTSSGVLTRSAAADDADDVDADGGGGGGGCCGFGRGFAGACMCKLYT